MIHSQIYLSDGVQNQYEGHCEEQGRQGLDDVGEAILFHQGLANDAAADGVHDAAYTDVY